MKVSFLSGEAIVRRIKRLVHTGRVNAAVAYWGRGATSLLGVSRPNLQILCDLWSGGCNCQELEYLIDGGAVVKTLEGFHAKVWLNGDTAIIGSANASTRGFSYLEKASDMGLEACVEIKDTDFVRNVTRWFERHWNDPFASPVGKPDLIAASATLPKRPKRAVSTGPTSFVRSLLSDEAAQRFKGVQIVAYAGGGVDPASEKAFSKFRSTYTKAQLEVYPDEDPYYEDCTGWPRFPGEILLDFQNPSRRRRFNFCGAWQIRQEPFVRAKTAVHPRNRIILCDPLRSVRGLIITRMDEKILAGAVSDYIERHGLQRVDCEATHFCNLDIPLIALSSEVRRQLRT